MEQKTTSVTTTSVASLTTLTPKALHQSYRGLQTIEQAIDVQADRIGALVRAYSYEKVAAIIKLQLIELNEVLQLNKPLTEQVIDMIADELIVNYSQLTIADVYLVMRRARTGAYGQFYESLNMPKVLIWFKEYFEDRCEIYAMRSQRDSEMHKSGDGIRWSENREAARNDQRQAMLRYNYEVMISRGKQE
jgi:hypothetical protein